MATHPGPVEATTHVKAGPGYGIGAFGQDPPTSRNTYTQTYSTADRTVAAATYAAPSTVTTALTDNGGGAAADGTIGAITLTEPANLAAQTTINNQLADAVKELSTKINSLRTNPLDTNTQLAALAADVLALKKNLTAIVDDLQATGMVA